MLYCVSDESGRSLKRIKMHSVSYPNTVLGLHHFLHVHVGIPRIPNERREIFPQLYPYANLFTWFVVLIFIYVT